MISIKQSVSDATRTAQQTAGALTGVARQTFFAGLGVVATLQTEAEKVFQNLVQEGRAVESGRSNTHTADAVQAVEAEVDEAVTEADEALTEAKAEAQAAAAKLDQRVTEAVKVALQRLNVPTREDVDALQKSVERLDKKTAALRAA